MRTLNYTKNSIYLFIIVALSAILMLAFNINAYADEATTVAAQQTNDNTQVGPAFDPDLNKASQQSTDNEAQPADGSTAATIDAGKPMIALTFDDGPYADNTARILSVLEANGAKATFFVLGQRVGGREAILQRAVAAGCEIGNHSYGHENLHKTPHDKTVQTINATSDAIQAACGVRPTLMRPPYGSSDASTLNTIGSLGMASINWNVDTNDWKTKNAQATIDHVLTHAKDGDIILMHDSHSTTADACETLIPELINRGFQLVTVSELASARGGLTPGVNYRCFRP